MAIEKTCWIASQKKKDSWTYILNSLLSVKVPLKVASDLLAISYFSDFFSDKS